MKGRLPPKASKASLVARGLAVKEKSSKPRSTTRSKQKKAATSHHPGYALYSTDSEAEQVTDVHNGLDRCAALLSHILDGEEQQGKEQQVQANHVVDHSKGKSKKFQTRRTLTRNKQHGGQSSVQGVMSAHGDTPSAHPIIVPQQRGASTPSRGQGKPLYNERLTSSTPVMTLDQRQRQESLVQRQELLEQQIVKLSKQYNFVKDQSSSEKQEQQKHLLQHSMLQQLQNYQDEVEALQQEASQEHNDDVNSLHGYLATETDILPHVDYNQSFIPTNSASHLQTPVVNPFVDHQYTDIPEQDQDIPEKDPGPNPLITQSFLGPMSQSSGSLPHANKQVAFSDNVMQRSFTPSPRCTSAVTQTSLDYNTYDDVNSPLPSPSSPKAVSSHVKTLQYLIGELRSLLGDSGDLEIHRLLNELDKAVSLLQYIQTGTMNLETNSIEMDLAIQPLRTENAHLRRKLRILSQKLKDYQVKMQQSSMLSSEPSFELSACQSLNEILKQQVEQERDIRGKMARQMTQLKKELMEVRQGRQELLDMLANKVIETPGPEQVLEAAKTATSREILEMTTKINSLQLSLEASNREQQITAISLKQRDEEVERLKEFTRTLQHSMKKLLDDVDELPEGTEIISLLSSENIIQDVDKLLQAPIIPERTKPTSRGSTTPKQTTQRHGQHARDASGYQAPYEPFKHELNNHLTNSQVHSKKSIRFTEPSSDEDEYDVYKSGPNNADAAWNITKQSNHTARQVTPNISPYKPELSPFRLSPSKITETAHERYDSSSEVSSLSSQDEVEFSKELANLDADIERLQTMLRQTASK